jgi:hypothetical protein
MVRGTPAFVIQIVYVSEKTPSHEPILPMTRGIDECQSCFREYLSQARKAVS